MPYPVKASSGNPVPMVIPWQLDWLHNSTESQCVLYACCLKFVHSSPVALDFCSVPYVL